jgi:hypothetical protein
MEIKDQIDLCLRQSDIGAERWNRRRDDEWRITLAFWVGILAAGKFLYDSHVTVGLMTGVWVGVAALVVLASYLLIWLRGLWAANHSDKAWEFHFRKAAAELLAGTVTSVSMPPVRTKAPSVLPPKWRDWKPFLADWSMMFQLLITAFLLLAVGWLLIAGHPNVMPVGSANGVPSGSVWDFL